MMFTRSLGRVAAAALVMTVNGAAVSVAFAQEVTTPATPAVTVPATDEYCLEVPAKLSDEDIQKFLGNPKSLLETEASGGLPLSNEVRSLAGSSLKAARALAEVGKTANDPQKAAIGAGFSRIIAACEQSHPDFVAKIQQIVAETRDDAIIQAFVSTSNDLKVASLGIPGVSGLIGGGPVSDGSGDIAGFQNTGIGSDSPLKTTSGVWPVQRGSGYFTADDGGSDNDSIDVSPVE